MNDPANTPPVGPNGLRPETNTDGVVFCMRRVLVPLDFSEHARKALGYALALARQFGATLVLMHVIEPMVYPADFGYTPLPDNALEQDFEREARTRLAAIAAEQAAAGFQVEHLVRIGKPYHEIALAATERRADLVVLTTHGYTGLTHVLLGSTAERVLRHAPCPVLVVRDPAPDSGQAAGAGAAAGAAPKP
jgi:nucleotide-binding universal stress UspA family protein